MENDKGGFMERLLLVPLFALLLLTTTTTTSWASSFELMTEEQMVSGAEAVVIGQVVAQRSFLRSRANVPLTETTLSVEENVLGTSPPTIAVVTAGAVGFPTFQSQERYLLFLHRVNNELRVLGYLQGQYLIVQDEVGRLLARSQVGPGTLFVTPDGRPTDKPPADTDLEFIKNRIREVGRRLGRN
jgi:hypothetical protein